MREILFRGRIDNGAWIEGFYFIARDAMDDDMHHYILEIESYVYPRGEIVEFSEVDPLTVGQYTGLTDKNGKKIFEGDIVFNNMTGRKLIGYLEERAAFCFCDKCITSPAFIGQYNFECFEVIGNATDNPELLEAGE